MSAAEVVKPAVGVIPLQVYIAGKVQKVRKQDSKFYTTILCPAKDEYSGPSIVEIRSGERLADADELYKGFATVGGFLGREFKYVDRNTGEERKARSVILTLDAVKS